MCNHLRYTALPGASADRYSMPDNPAGKGIRNGCQVDKASSDTDVSDVGKPYLVQMADSHPFDNIGMPGEAVAAIGSLRPLTCLTRHSRSLSLINCSTFLLIHHAVQ